LKSNFFSSNSTSVSLPVRLRLSPALIPRCRELAWIRVSVVPDCSLAASESPWLSRVAVRERFVSGCGLIVLGRFCQTGAVHVIPIRPFGERCGVGYADVGAVCGALGIGVAEGCSIHNAMVNHTCGEVLVLHLVRIDLIEKQPRR
jgi:hypothetical protein